MQGSRNKGGDGETVSKGDGDDVVPGGFDRADPDEDQRERSNEFSEQRAKFSHEVMQSDRFRVDNSVWISARRTGTRLRKKLRLRLRLRAGAGDMNTSTHHDASICSLPCTGTAV